MSPPREYRRPPWLADVIVRLALPSDAVGRSILGDLREEHAVASPLDPRSRAGWYWRQALGVSTRYGWRRTRQALGFSADPDPGKPHAPEHHSESTEAMFAHIPGLRVVIPSSPRRAYGLLLSAIRDPDPVVFLEPKRIYRAVREDVEDDGEGLPLDSCFVQREGTDITLVSWGAMMHETLAAADLLAEQGTRAEVIDVATLRPLDMDTILASVEKTGRCVIVHEAVLSNGVGAEIAARIGEDALLSLLAPVGRVGGYDTIMPLSRLEALYMPSAERVVAAARRALEFE